MTSDSRKTKAQLIAELDSLRHQVANRESELAGCAVQTDRFRTMVDGLPQIIFEMDLDGRFTYTNDFALKTFGYERRDIEQGLGMTDIIHPSNLDRARKNMARILRDDESPGLDYLAIRRDGTTLPIKIYSQVVRENGRPTHIRGVVFDISDIRQAQDALEERNRYYRTLFENTGTAAVIFGSDAVLRSCNAQFEVLSGYSRDELEHVMTWHQFVHPDDLVRMREYHAKRLRDGNNAPEDYEFTFLARDNVRKQVHAFLSVIPGTEDRICSLIDVTKRRRTEEALSMSEQRYRDLFTYASDGVFQCTPDGEFINANPAMAEMMGYDSPADFIQSVSDISRDCYVNPDDRSRFLKKLREVGFLNQYEVHLKRKDGARIWASENVRAVYDDEGEFIFYEGFIRDITERKQHERTSQALYAISKAISTTSDLQELYESIHAILGEFINAQNFLISHYEEAEDRIALTYVRDDVDEYSDIRDISDPATSSPTVEVFRTGKPLFLSLANPEDRKEWDRIGVRGTLSQVWLGVPLKIRGKTIGTMTVQHYSDPHHYTKADVAFMEAVSEQVALAIERKSNEEALNRLNEELETMVEDRTVELRSQAAELEAANKRLTELDEIKSALISSISHELRTPLTSIRGFAKLTSKDFLRHFLPMATDDSLARKGERIRHNLDIIEAEGVRLTRLINDFLDLNRIESGVATWNDTFLNACEIVDKSVRAVSGAFAAKKGVELVADLPKSVATIHADPDKIQQVLINLLNNAYKFTSQGTVAVSVSSTDTTLTVTVTDSGPGIPVHEQPRIFEKFHKSRSGDTVSTKDKGTGLGLAICKEIVEHYEGSIWVESTPGKGSVFSFTLPAVPGAVTAC